MGAGPPRYGLTGPLLGGLSLNSYPLCGTEYPAAAASPPLRDYQEPTSAKISFCKGLLQLSQKHAPGPPDIFLPAFCLFSLCRPKLCRRAKCIQTAEAVIFMTPLPGSFLCCPLSFVKVKGILPRQLSDCYLGWNRLPELHKEYFMKILHCTSDGSSVTTLLLVPCAFLFSEPTFCILATSLCPSFAPFTGVQRWIATCVKCKGFSLG